MSLDGWVSHTQMLTLYTHLYCFVFTMIDVGCSERTRSSQISISRVIHTSASVACSRWDSANDGRFAEYSTAILERSFLMFCTKRPWPGFVFLPGLDCTSSSPASTSAS